MPSVTQCVLSREGSTMWECWELSLIFLCIAFMAGHHVHTVPRGQKGAQIFGAGVPGGCESPGYSESNH